MEYVKTELTVLATPTVQQPADKPSRIPCTVSSTYKERNPNKNQRHIL